MKEEKVAGWQARSAQAEVSIGEAGQQRGKEPGVSGNGEPPPEASMSVCKPGSWLRNWHPNVWAK